AYGSPEQLRQEALSTRSDVYSLGVLLYQMLTDQLPFPPKNDTPTAYKEFILSGKVKVPSVLAEFAASDIQSSTLMGDLDAIIMKCLEKEAEKRYGSVDALIADVEAYLTDRPISLRSNDSWYGLQKYAFRNRAWLSAVAVGLLAIITLGIYYTTEVTKERNEALAESRKNEQLLGFVTDIFQEADPLYAQGDTLTVFDLLDQASERIDSTLEGEPELYAEMHLAIGGIYQGMGAYDKADTLVKAGLSMVDEHPDLQGGDLQSKLFYLESDIYYGLGNYQEARNIAESGLEIQRTRSSKSKQMCLFYQRLGDLAIEETNYPEADSQYQLALACFQSQENPDKENMASMMHSLGHLNRELNRLDSAEMFLSQSLRLKEEIYEAPHSEIAYTLNNLASLFYQKVEYDSAIYYARESYVQRRKVFGLGHVETVASIGNMSRIYHQQEEWDSSLVYKYLMNTSLDQIFDGPHPYKVSALDQIGRLLLTLNRLDEADSIYEKDIAAYQELLQAQEGNAYSKYGVIAYEGKGMVHYQEGEYRKALPYLEKAHTLSLEMGNEPTHEKASSRYYLGLCQRELGRNQESEKNLLEAREYFLTAPVRYEKQLVKLDTLLSR
ncbi:MAG: tetratricopeptide repeat-containing protein kinase family protein, partial [Bacteroidota bacterium]